MPQLRDKNTSAPIFEGGIDDALALADVVGWDEVLFDDVGVDFDPQSAWEARNARVAELEKLSRSRAEGTTSDDRAAAKQALTDLEVAESPEDVRERLEQAREQSRVVASSTE